MERDGLARGGRHGLRRLPRGATLARRLTGESPEHPTARLNLGETEARPVLRLPDEYTAGGPVGGIFSEMPFAMWTDTLLVGFMPLPYLIVADTTGRELDRFEVPGARRRGGTADPEAAIDEVLEGGRPYPEVVGRFSVTRGVHRRPDGSFVVIHFDLGTGTGSDSTAGLWVSVIDESRETACVDGAIVLEADSRASFGFEGNVASERGSEL